MTIFLFLCLVLSLSDATTFQGCLVASKAISYCKRLRGLCFSTGMKEICGSRGRISKVGRECAKSGREGWKSKYGYGYG